MKVVKAIEALQRIANKNGSNREFLELNLVIKGKITAITPSIEIESIHEGFDFDVGKVLMKTSVEVSALTAEEKILMSTSLQEDGSLHLHNQRLALEAKLIEANALIAEYNVALCNIAAKSGLLGVSPERLLNPKLAGPRIISAITDLVDESVDYATKDFQLGRRLSA